MRRSLVLAVGLSFFALTGCGKVKEKIAEKIAEKAIGAATGTDVDIDTSSESVSFRDSKTGAKAEYGTASLPDGWPSSAPIYPGAKIVASMSLSEGKQASFTTPDSVDKVHAFYKAKLPGKQEAALDFGESKTLTHKDDSMTYMVTIGGGKKDGTTVMVMVAPIKKK